MDRIIPGGGDRVHRVPPGHPVLLIFVAVIGDRPVIDLPHPGDQPAPFPLPAVRADHFASDAEHLRPVFLRHPRDPADVVFPGFKPFRPAGLRRHILVKEPDIGAPVSVPAVDHRLQDHPETQVLRLFEDPPHIRLIHHVRMIRIHPGGIGMILPRADRKDDGIASRGPLQLRQGPFPSGAPGKPALFTESKGIRVQELFIPFSAHLRRPPLYHAGLIVP